MDILKGEHVAVQVKKRMLFSDFSFAIGQNEKVLLQGDSGSGKSTLLHTILGFHPLKKGRIEFEGKPLNEDTIHNFRKETVYVPQKLKFSFPSVRELLMFPFTFKHNKKRKPNPKAIAEWLERFELPADILENSPDNISGGEMQRIVLIASLLQNKRLYLMDEPTSAMDQNLRHKILRIITNKPFALLVTSHDQVWETYTDRLLHFSSG